MGVACSPDNFHAEISELIASPDCMCIYIDDVLCVTKGSLDDHLAKLRMVIIRL